MNIQEWKAENGAKRFRRTKEEIASGFTPAEALQKRLLEAEGKQAPILGSEDKKDDKPSRKSNITILVSAAAKTDSDYFEHLPASPVKIELDQSWYTWYDTLVTGPFEGDANKLLKFILDQGIETVLTKFHFPSDIEK